MRPFCYCLDPIFLASVLLYALNRLCVAPLCGAAVPFLTSYFGDVLLIPCALPVLLWLQRLARLRTHDLPPTPGEIVSTLALWAVLFEVAFPHFAGHGVSDPLDVLAYATGALLASFAWTLHHRCPATTPA
jgi:hypothetical protein